MLYPCTNGDHIMATESVTPVHPTYCYILWCIYSRRRERVVGWPASACLRLVVSTRRLQRRHPHSTTASINNDNIPPTASISRISSTHLHHPVESYTVIICQQSYLLLFGIPSPTHSFIPGLKPSFSANPSHRSPSFFFFGIHYMDSPDCLLLFLSTSVF